jgi:hypothetical protein
LAVSGRGGAQAAEHGQVLGELDPLVNALRRVLEFPVPCPASVAGLSEPARASADNRGQRPRASSAPAPTGTAQLMRTTWSVSFGNAGIRSLTGCTTASACRATRSGFRQAW